MKEKDHYALVGNNFRIEASNLVVSDFGRSIQPSEKKLDDARK